MVDLRDIVKGTPEAEAAMHRAMEQAQADMEAVRLAAEKHNGKQSTSSLTIDGKDVKLDEILDLYAQQYFQLLRTPTIEAKNIKDRKRAEAKQAIQALITQAKKDLLAELKEEMPDDEEIVEQRPGEVETFLHNQHAIGFNDCLTQALAAIDEIEEKL